ncbi:hypothetical protein [Thermococcus sp.]|uniref:hypothetical protein n=1 Tax=Thermococcus sp. TaxID=35749 RepID=UPI00260F5A75|nr:hypothetical protein [Thermococcus sp.]
MEHFLNSVALFGIFLLSLIVGRVSPNGFRRDFALSLVLFSQLWIALKLGIEYGYWLGLAFGFVFLNAFLVLLGIFELKFSQENLNRGIEKIHLITFTSIFVLVLILSEGISEYTKSNLLGLLFGYSLGLVPLFGILKSSGMSRKTAFSVLIVSACFYYAVVGFVIGWFVSPELGVITALIFTIASCWSLK